jgi:hypothetical protein
MRPTPHWLTKSVKGVGKEGKPIDQERPLRATVLSFSHSGSRQAAFATSSLKMVAFAASIPSSDYQAIAAIASHMRGPPFATARSCLFIGHRW